jgi:putative addiction module killer protein
VSLFIREYVTAEGSCPYRDWIEAANVSVRARIQARVFRFEMGNLGDHKTIGDGVWEARLMFGPGYRIYFGKDGPYIIVLLLGGDKASQRKDIQRAKLYWADYLEAKKHGKT